MYRMEWSELSYLCPLTRNSWVISSSPHPFSGADRDLDILVFWAESTGRESEALEGRAEEPSAASPTSAFSSSDSWPVAEEVDSPEPVDTAGSDPLLFGLSSVLKVEGAWRSFRERRKRLRNLLEGFLESVVPPEAEEVVERLSVDPVSVVLEDFLLKRNKEIKMNKKRKRRREEVKKKRRGEVKRDKNAVPKRHRQKKKGS